MCSFPLCLQCNWDGFCSWLFKTFAHFFIRVCLILNARVLGTNVLLNRSYVYVLITKLLLYIYLKSLISLVISLLSSGNVYLLEFLK